MFMPKQLMPMLFIGLFPVLNCLAQAEASDPLAEKSAIRTLLFQQQDDWNYGDLEGFMTGYLKSDSIRFVGSSGVIMGYDNTLERYRRTYPDKAAMGTLTFELLDVQLMGGVQAMVLGSFSLQRESDNPTGLFTLILVKTADGWKITHDHTTASEN